MQKTIFIILVSIGFCFWACKKETGIAGPTGPQGNQGASGNLKDTGSLSGHLSLFNEFAWPVNDSSGVKVSADNGNQIQSATTDASGYYVFHGLPRGTYNLTFTRQGFGTMKLFGISHAPDNHVTTPVPEVALAQTLSKTKIDSIVLLPNYNYVIIDLFLDTSSNNYVQPYEDLVLLVGKDPNVSLSHYLVTYSEYLSPDPSSGGYTAVVDKSNLAGLFQPGDTIYITANTFTRFAHKLKDSTTIQDLGTAYYYIDPATGDYVYPNLSSPPAILKIPY